MAGVYRPRHPERTVLYRVLSHHFDSRMIIRYEGRDLAYRETLERQKRVQAVGRPAEAP